ncbi:Prospero homeobox protein 1 [Anabarilius grahami]|uniref:Prospero homeobox protein 1 n=1 Tax=Anabarilius grahami TaxID=495550 RepID=A0A3N0YQK2_ANAGA|nr:Prospero homeobox protein 1 [Anabarilius grahami]
MIPEPSAAASNCGKRKLQHLLKQLEIMPRPRLTAVWIATDAKEARNPKSDGPPDGNERRQLSLPQHQDIPFPGPAFVSGDARETKLSTVPDRFLEVAEITLQEFYSAVSLSKDSDPSWKKAIYKVICKLDSDVPEDFKSPSYL